MAQTAFFVTDRFDGKIKTSSGFTPDMPFDNVSKDSPGIQGKALEGTLTTGAFETGSSNKWIDINEGGGDIGVAMPNQQWLSPQAMGAELQAQINASALPGADYTVTWLNGVFAIGKGAGTFEITWKTGSHGADNSANNIGTEMGFTAAADTGLVSSVFAEAKRYSTTTSLVIDMGTARELNAIVWYAEGDSDTLFDDVRLYIDTTLRGFTRDAWIDASSTAITLSNRSSTQAHNLIQVGFQDPATATSRQWAHVSWRHFDESTDHRVGLCKAFSVLWDTTNSRTIGPLREHQPISSAQPRNVQNYYAPPGIVRWSASMSFPDWEIASWEEVVLALAEHSFQAGTLWVEDFATLDTASTTAILADVDAGLVLWGTIQNMSGGDAAGQQDLYRTSSLTFEQLP